MFVYYSTNAHILLPNTDGICHRLGSHTPKIRNFQVRQINLITLVVGVGVLFSSSIHTELMKSCRCSHHFNFPYFLSDFYKESVVCVDVIFECEVLPNLLLLSLASRRSCSKEYKWENCPKLCTHR